MSDIGRGSLTAEQVAEYTDALTRHYGERVAPVSDYCQGFYDWERAIRAKVERLRDGTEYSADVRKGYGKYFDGFVDSEIQRWTAVLDALATISLPLAKSSMLGRRIYGGEKLRTVRCPEHNGQWQGLAFVGSEPSCGCHLTGWLP